MFIIYSCFGWIYESIYCTIKGKKWENRGFLYGPVCPIYGTGAVTITILVEQFARIGITYKWWMVFLVCYAGSVVLEYTTHWALEKLFHAYWWDYSYMPLNIKGRVCVPYSICFGLAGLLVTYVLTPFMEKIISWIPQIGFEFIGLIFMMILGMDIALTASALSEFENYVVSAEDSLNEHMDAFVEGIEGKYGQMAESMSAKIAEEREKFSRENIAAKMQGMSELSKGAIKRVKGYKPAIGEKIARNRILEFVKNHKPEGKNA